MENFNLLESDRFMHLYIGLFNRNLYSILDSKDKYFEKYFSDENSKSSDHNIRFIYQDLFYLLQLKMRKNHFRDPRLSKALDKKKMDNYLISYFFNKIIELSDFRQESVYLIEYFHNYLEKMKVQKSSFFIKPGFVKEKKRAMLNLKC